MSLRLEEKKIMALRKARKISQKALANAINVKTPYVAKVEKGTMQYSDEQLMLAKELLKIEDMPLSKLEVASCKGRIHIARDYVRDGRIIEAKAILSELAALVNLEPCDDYLPILYRLLEVIVMLAERNFDVVAKKLNYLQGRLEDMNDEHRFFFFINMGEFELLHARYEDALVFYKQAKEQSPSLKDILPYENTRLHIHTALCYSYLEFPYRAILYMQEASGLHEDRITDKIGLTADFVLAISYIKVRNFKEAERLLDSCLLRAVSIKDDIRTCVALHHLGLLHSKTGNWKTAIEYLDQALKYHKKSSADYLIMLYRKIRCISGSRRFAKAKKLLADSKPIYNTNRVFAVDFEALSHYITVSSRLTLYNDQSVEYIETVAIPYFESKYYYFEAIDYYKLLESYYEIKNNKKSLLMSAAIRKIYERCLFMN